MTRRGLLGSGSGAALAGVSAVGGAAAATVGVGTENGSLEQQAAATGEGSLAEVRADAALGFRSVATGEVLKVPAAEINRALSGPFGYYCFGPGVTEVDGAVVPTEGSTLCGVGTASVVRLAARTAEQVAVITNAPSGEVTGPAARITIRDLVIDGNGSRYAPLGSPGGAKTSRAAVYLLRTPSLTMDNVHAVNTKALRAFYFDGDGVGDNRVLTITNIHCYDNTTPAAAFSVSHTSRQVLLNNIQVYRNTTRYGIFLDVSELSGDGIYAYANTGIGVKINNVHSCNLRGITALFNGEDGIFVEEFVSSTGSNWKAAGNGTSGTPGSNGFAEVKFTGFTDQSYGVTRDCNVDGIDVSTFLSSQSSIGGGRTADYGVFIGDGATGDVILTGVQLGQAGQLARLRMPDEPGTTTVTTVDGIVYPAAKPAAVNRFAADPAIRELTSPSANFAAGGCTLAIASFSGKRAVKATCTPGARYHQVTTRGGAGVDVTPGEVIPVSIATATDAAIEEIALLAVWVGAEGGVISTTEATRKQPSTRGYSRTSEVVKVPPGAVKLRLRVELRPRAALGSAVAYLTEICVGSYTYFDGDTPGYRWTGAPHASPSSKVTALTPADNTPVKSDYSTDEAEVIRNLRMRVGELEAILERSGLIGT